MFGCFICVYALANLVLCVQIGVCVMWYEEMCCCAEVLINAWIFHDRVNVLAVDMFHVDEVRLSGRT